MTNISVVIAICNAQDWIEETLESVRAQTFPAGRVETIIVDDKSSDDSVAMARSFLIRHGMRGRVIETEHSRGIAAARDRGWRAAAGDWIQFLDAGDLLAPNKLERQAILASQARDDTAVICSNWQRLGLVEDKWQPYGPVTEPDLHQSVILRVLTRGAGMLGPALVRRRFLEIVSGFSEEVRYAEQSHVLLKIAAAGGKFVETSTPTPLFFHRLTPQLQSRPKVDVARQHIENVIIAERMLREQKYGELSLEDIKEIGRLCDWALSELYEHDQSAFRQYLHWLQDLDPAFVPEHSSKLKLASRVLGYETAESVASGYRRVRTWAGTIFASSTAKPAAGPGAV